MRYLFRIVVLAVAMVTFSLPAAAVLKVGDRAPDFSLHAYLAGKPFTFNLADALKKGPVVVYFFPAPHTPGCDIEAHLYSQAMDKFKAKGVSVIGVSAGNLDQMAVFSRQTRYCSGKFPVAADQGAKVAREYDALLEQRPGWSNRTSYLIAPSGRIVSVYSSLNPEQHVKRMLAAVQAYKNSL